MVGKKEKAKEGKKSILLRYQSIFSKSSPILLERHASAQCNPAILFLEIVQHFPFLWEKYGETFLLLLFQSVFFFFANEK